MSEKRYAHDFDGLMKSTLSRISKDTDISKRNKELILKFRDDCFSQGMGKPRVLFYMNRLLIIGRRIDVDFDKATEADIKRLLAKLTNEGYTVKKAGTTTLTKHYSDSSINDYKVTLKKFYKWIGGGKYPEAVEFIKIKGNNGRKLPEDILTREDAQKIIASTIHQRDRAMVHILWEAGVRIGELLGLKIKDVNFDNNGAIIMVNGKTGQRRVRLVTAVNDLAEWLKIHPDKDNREADLWTIHGVRNNGKRATYASVRMMLSRVAKRAGVQKRANPHAFRHASASFYASFLNEAQLNERYGWVHGSKMTGVYVHMSGKQLDDAILRIHGKAPEEEQDKLDKKSCPRCDKEHDISTKYCGDCGMPLDLEIAMNLENKREEFEDKIAPIMEVLKDPEVQKLIANKMTTPR